MAGEESQAADAGIRVMQHQTPASENTSKGNLAVKYLSSMCKVPPTLDMSYMRKRCRRPKCKGRKGCGYGTRRQKYCADLVDTAWVSFFVPFG